MEGRRWVGVERWLRGEGMVDAGNDKEMKVVSW